MSSLAIQSIPGRAVSPELKLIDRRRTIDTRAQDLQLLGALFIALQIIDGLLTFHGVSLRGTGVEANLLIRHLMDQVGIGTALVLVKSLAIMCVLIVCIAGAQIRWVRPALITLIGTYTALAVVPWSMLLFVF